MQLRNFQQIVVDKVLVHPFEGRALLAMEMGLGKTAVSLRIFGNYLFMNPATEMAVVVCPASLRLNWKRECEAWLHFAPNSTEICVVRTGKCRIYGTIVIMSYEQATKRIEQLKALGVTMVILDESHYIKNVKAKRTKAIVPLCRETPRVLLLTGTPVLNRPIELWAQLAALRRSLGNYNEFATRFCGGHRRRVGSRFIWDVSGASNVQKLNELLNRDIMIRMLKKDVLTELPPKQRVKLVVEGAGKLKQRNAIEEVCLKVLESCKFRIVDAMKQLRKQKISDCIFTAFAELCEIKKQDSAEIVIDLASNGQPLVVFAHHKAMIHHIAQALELNSISFGIIDGSTHPSVRQKVVDDFQAKKIRVALLSLTAASTGLTLTAASDMLIVELPWGPGLALQAEDRIHRIGQGNAALIRYIVCENTLDDHLWGLISTKAELTGSILDATANTEFTDAEHQALGSYWDLIHSILLNLKDRYEGHARCA